uniref:Uncharacterized protein MANES_13G076700 n=1 Tax=Rhizophora mucronata TaxID=61149 RepID=A0A2P2IU04_RHIMU
MDTQHVSAEQCSMAAKDQIKGFKIIQSLDNIKEKEK